MITSSIELRNILQLSILWNDPRQTNLSDILNVFSPSDRLFNATIPKYKYHLKMKKLTCLFSDNLAFLHILSYNAKKQKHCIFSLVLWDIFSQI